MKPPREVTGRGFAPALSPEAEVAEELQGHLELLAGKYVGEGMSIADARKLAHARFGNVESLAEECQMLRHDIEEEVVRTEWKNDLASDVRFSLRSMRRHPMVTAITVVTLALGIGAGVGVLNIVYTVLGKPLPYANAARIVTVWNSYPAGQLLQAAVSVPEYFDYKEHLASVEHVAAIKQEKVPLVDEAGEATELVAYRSSPNLFALLGSSTAIGRSFNISDGSTGSAPVVMLSDALWRRQFGRDRAVIGQTLDIAGIRRMVIGVMPPGVAFPDLPLSFLAEPADIWIPDSFETLRNDERGNQNIGVLLLPRATAKPGNVRRDLDQLEARFRQDHPSQYAPPATMAWRIADVTLYDEFFGRVRAQMLLLAVAAISLVFIACTNAANLLLARGAGRAGEFSVRRALGAERQRLMRQLLTESTAMAVVAGAIGAYFAHTVVQLAVNANSVDVPRLATARMSAAWLGLTMALAIVAGLIVGLAPALRLSVPAVQGGAVSQPHRRRRLQRGLGMVQMALTLTVLIATGLFMRSFLALRRVDTGFHAGNVATAGVTLPRLRYDSAYKVAAFATQLVEQLKSGPTAAGVNAVALIYPLPLSGSRWSGTFALDEPAASGVEMPHAEYAVTSPDYFRTMRIPIREGREFTVDDRRGADGVAIVDEQLARRYWPGASAIGKRIRVGGTTGRVATVVGVVGHVRNGGARDDGEPQLYLPIQQSPQRLFFVVMRSDNPAAALQTIGAGVHAVDARQPVARVASMESLVRAAVASDRFNLTILGIFGTVALTLVTLGLYGLVALSATERLNELGVRLALGARLWNVRWLVIRDGAFMLLGGIAVGIGLSVSLSQLVETMLFGVKSLDFMTYAGIVALMTAVTLAAALRVSLRATASTALRALRQS